MEGKQMVLGGVWCVCVCMYGAEQGFGLYPEEIGKLLKDFTEWSCVIGYYFKGDFGSCQQGALEGFQTGRGESSQELLLYSR